MLVEEAAGRDWCATRGQADIRGLATAGPGFVFRARRLATGVTGPWSDRLPIGVSRMLWREGPSPAASSTNVVPVRLVGGRDRPAEPGEFARRGDGDDRAALVALLHPLPDVMQPALRVLGEREDLGLRVDLAAREVAGDPGRTAVVPGCFDEQPPGVLAAGLRDRAAAAAFAGGVL